MNKSSYLAILIAALLAFVAPLQAKSDSQDADLASESPAQSEEAKAEYEAMLKEVEKTRIEALKAAELAREAATQQRSEIVKARALQREETAQQREEGARSVPERHPSPEVDRFAVEGAHRVFDGFHQRTEAGVFARALVAYRPKVAAGMRVFSECGDGFVGERVGHRLPSGLSVGGGVCHASAYRIIGGAVQGGRRPRGCSTWPVPRSAVAFGRRIGAPVPSRSTECRAPRTDPHERCSS